MYLFDYAKGVAVRKLQLHSAPSLRVSGPQDVCQGSFETASTTVAAASAMSCVTVAADWCCCVPCR